MKHNILCRQSRNQRFRKNILSPFQPWIWRHYVYPKRWILPTSSHCITTQNRIYKDQSWLLSVVYWLSWLPTGPCFACSNSAEDDEFLRALKIRRTTPCGGEIRRQSLVTRCEECWRTLRSMKEIIRRQNLGNFSPRSSASLLGVSAVYCHMALVDK
jgi:hypothetical protein